MSVVLSSSLVAALLLSSHIPVAQQTLTVAAAADLTNLTPLLERQFEKTNPSPSVWVRFVAGPSAILSQQIEGGAIYDLFLSANAQFVDHLGSIGKLAPDSVRTYAVGRVGLVWHDGKSHPISDLTQNWVRFVALPNARLAPYGAAARQALEHTGTWKQIQGKIVYGEDVRQALQLFDSGNADAVLTAASLLYGRKFDLVPADWHAPIVQKAGIVADSRNREVAERFLTFLLSPAGQAIFAQFGFGPPPKP